MTRGRFEAFKISLSDIDLNQKGFEKVSCLMKPKIWSSVYKITQFKVLTYSFSNVITDTAVLASNPVVGSSKHRMLGEVISSIPMLVRFFSPPDTPRVY